MNSSMTGREVRRLVDDYIGTVDGYLKHFSYSSHEAFYHTYCEMDVDVRASRAIHGSTRRTFEGILRDSKPEDQAKIIRGVVDLLSEKPEFAAPEKKAFEAELLAVAARLEIGGNVRSPDLIVTTQTIRQALEDAELLLTKNGAPSAVDRAHTALHGFLKKICADRRIEMGNDPSMTALFGLIRNGCPELKAAAHDQEAKKLFGSIATALDTLNFIRNRGSLAHANDLILDVDEATLFINLSRAVLTYLDAKVYGFLR
jgi:hypothetical protein